MCGNVFVTGFRFVIPELTFKYEIIYSSGTDQFTFPVLNRCEN